MQIEEQIDTLPAGIKFIAEDKGTREYRLANNLKVLLVENRVAPVATFLVLYKVGSRNEAVGHTGATHLLEHMMFKGTPTFNKNENTQIAATLQKIGAAFNATTWYDRTNYFETVPSDQLELAIKLEADRMRNSLIADSDRQSEMTVVRNELDRGQNEPMMVLDESVYATAFREHPYHHPTIGWRADVENVPTARLKAFYDTFYHPSNATAILVGDFEREHALDLISKYFGNYPASSESIPEVYTNEPEQQGERRITVRRPGELALLQIAFHTPAALGQTTVLSSEELQQRAAAPPVENDIYPLVVLSTILTGGISSRLYQALVETELAVHVVTNVDQFRDPGLFNIYVTVSPDAEPKAVEEAVLNELARVADEELSADELAKAQGQILAHVAYTRDGTHNVAAQMSEAEAIADWRFYKDYAANIERVTAADVRRVAQKYFTEDNRTVGTFLPKHDTTEGNAHGGDADATRGERSLALRQAKELTPPRRMQFFSPPNDGDHIIVTASDENAAEEKGASTTPQAKEQQLIAGRDDKSSNAVEANNAQSASKTEFASRVERVELK
nr:insulinase family protein [Pyrinomonadaceae bacterium]